MKIKREKQFISLFDEKTGRYLRTGILKNGKDTGVDPFMASFPELLDVGIMGHCKHGRAGLCVKAGIECYQDGLHSYAENMRVEDFRRIAEECKGKTFQFALGGCGDPDQHEHFKEILEICNEAGIAVNFTSSGLGFNEEIVRLCKKYCGAVAVSWYRSPYTIRAIEMLTEAGVKTNIHYVLTKDTIAEAISILQNEEIPKKINAIIFLLHKPIGLGTQNKIVRADQKEFLHLLQMIDEKQFSYKIGFDSCTVPALIRHCDHLDMDHLDTCEAGRWSAYITPDMKMIPCSFDNQELRWATDLKTLSIQEAWDSEVFERFRSILRDACPDCCERNYCMGGCPICPEIVLCSRNRKIGLGM